MPPLKRSCVGRSTRKTKYMKLSRLGQNFSQERARANEALECGDNIPKTFTFPVEVVGNEILVPINREETLEQIFNCATNEHMEHSSNEYCESNLQDSSDEKFDENIVVGRNARNCQRMALKRLAESEYVVQERRAQDLVRHKEARALETRHQREARQHQNRSRMVESRASYSINQQIDSLEKRRIHHMVSIGRCLIDLKKTAFRYNASVDYSLLPKIELGGMDEICRFCQARRFPFEATGICCSNGKVR